MSFWIFGYGSLVWRPAMPFLEREGAFIEGWSRRFWQGSTDHRGLPENPGRVVTLVPDAGARCWGMAYRVAGDVWDQVLGVLDHREKGGYERREVMIHLRRRHSPVRGLVYIATPDNPNYLGPASLEEIALQVRSAQGPSGHNLEYVRRLAAALETMSATDEHVAALAALVGSGSAREVSG